MKFVQSFWSENQPGPAYPPYSGAATADAVVIGGGITGASVALHLAEAGREVVLLESNHIGFGASGRNGGQVIPGLKRDPDELAALFGEEGERLALYTGTSADKVFALIDKYNIKCSPVRHGWVQGAHSKRAMANVVARARQWQKRAAPVDILSRDEVVAILGTTRYHGAMIDRRAGAVQPFEFVRGLARAAATLGARVHEASPVRAIDAGDGIHRLRTDAGELSARHVVIATDAYAGNLWPGLAQSYVGVNSIQLVSTPLPAQLRAAILPGSCVVSETRKLSYYFRQTPDGRFVIGGRGPLGDLVREEQTRHVARAAVELFPALEGVDWEYAWAGPVGITTDYLPQLAQLRDGIVAIVGYCGRGVAMATLMGEVLMRFVLGQSVKPFELKPLRTIPFHALRKPGIAAAISWYKLTDALGVGS